MRRIALASGVSSSQHQPRDSSLFSLRRHRRHRHQHLPLPFNLLTITSPSHAGHDFRPDYKGLSILRESFPDTQILALTATATHDVRQDVVKVLKVGRVGRVLRVGVSDATGLTRMPSVAIIIIIHHHCFWPPSYQPADAQRLHLRPGLQPS